MLKFKKMHPDAVLPYRASPGAAGYDLTATECHYSAGTWTCCTGLSVEIPEGFVGLLYPRSSISNRGLILANSVGVIDSDYRGEIMVKFKPLIHMANIYEPGERIAQIVFTPCLKVGAEFVNTLSDTERGEGGFGSTNKTPTEFSTCETTVKYFID